MESFMKQKIVKPKTLACYICGRQQFFVQFIPKVWYEIIDLTSEIMSKRLTSRQKLNVFLHCIKVPQQPEMLNIIISQIENGTLDQLMLEKYNQQARNIHKYKVLPSCKYCGRTFNEESLISHMKACPKKDSSSNCQQKSSYKMPDDMKKPRTLACCICGRQFGLTSLKIHYPQCKQRFRNQELKKPFKQRNPTPQYSKEDQQMINQKSDWTVQEINEFNQRATENYRNKALIQCQNCKRKFFPESYQKHLKNCKFINGDNMSQSVNLQEKSKNSNNIYEQVIKKPKVLMCHICGRQFGLTSLKIHQKTCVQKWMNEQKKRPKSQRRPIPELVFDNNEDFDIENALGWDSNKISKYNQVANQVYRGCALFPCLICGRKFFQQSLARHLKYCENNAEQKRLKQQVAKNASFTLNKQGGNSDFIKSNKIEENKISSNSSVIKSNKNNHQETFKTKDQDPRVGIQQDNDENIRQELKQDKTDKNFNATIKQVNEDLESTLNENKKEKILPNKQQQVPKQQKKLTQQLPLQNIDIDRVECSKCGRKFAFDRITKHQSICKGQTKKLLKPIVDENIPFNEIDQSQIAQKNQQKFNPINKKKFKNQEQKQEDLINQLVQCGKCGKKFIPTKIEKHQAKCKDVAFKVKNKQKKEQFHEVQSLLQKQIKPILQRKTENQIEANKSQLKPTSRIKLQKIPDSKINKNVTPQNQSNTHLSQSVQQIPTNLTKCKYCNRKFGQDRIQKHQNVCLNKKDFEQKQMQNLKQASKTNGFKNNKITGVSKIEASKIQLNKNFPQQQIQQSQKNLNLVPCSKCGRKFDSQRLKIHQNICKGQSVILKRKNDKNFLKIPQNNQNENKSPTNQLHQISKTPQIHKKNNFHIKTVSKQHQTKPDITSSQILRKQAIKQNLQVTEQIMNQIWDTKETKLKSIQKIELKTNVNQIKQKKFLSKVNKTSLEGGFYKRSQLQLKKEEKQEIFEIDESQKVDRVPCKKCGRKFATDRISKHEQICKVSKFKQQQANIKQRRTSISQTKQPLKSAQKFYQAKQQITASLQIPDSQKIIKQFKQIKNMKINESFIDNQIQKQLHQLNRQRQMVSEIKNSGFNDNVDRVRNTFGGGEKFYFRNNKSGNKMDIANKRGGSQSPKPIIAKKWFK